MTLTAVLHVLRFVVYLMAGGSAAGLIVVLYLLFQLEYDGAVRVHLTKWVDRV